jgi:uncharacterized SAM-binding protein YcdF (DUF218 family)
MKRWLVIAGAVVAVALAVHLGHTAILIRQQSVADEARPADVIVVLGAAEYRGKPSPVLRARLEHALDLFQRGIAPRILTTGGAGGDPIFTESDVGRAWLIQRGVPSEAIIVEEEGDSTAHSLSVVVEIMRRMQLNSCVVVSDGYHIYRVKRMLKARGVTVYGSPRPANPHRSRSLWWLYLRQAVGSLLWEVGINI